MSAELRIVLAGFGGQGVLFAGKVAAYAGLIDDREVSWLPSYGPEMRGGTANCSVTLSDAPIGSPLITAPNVLVALNQPSYDKFVDEVQPGGVIIADTSMIADLRLRDDVECFGVPATKIAEENGLGKGGNMVLLGKLFEVTKFCDWDTLMEGLRHCIPASKAHLLDNNIKAIKLGMEA